MTDLQQELDFVLDLVRACGPIALGYQAGGPRILGTREKPLGGGPITAADREINDRIVNALAGRFPEDAILAEESDDDGRWCTAQRCWHVDPIDGTRDFARGRPGWTIQIGLCIDGEPVLGVVAEPGARRVAWGLVTPETTVAMQRSDEGPAGPIAPSQSTFESLVLIGGRIFPLSRQHAIRRALEIDPARARSVGSVGIRMTSVARGDADVYVQAPGRTKTWDTCAPSALLRAVGARVTDLHGNPLRYRGPTIAHPHGLVASTGPHHDTILERLAPLTARWLPGS